MNLAFHKDDDSDLPVDIVVVDDDQLTLEMVSWIFRDTPSTHRLFSDPECALASLCESMPGVLIVDYYMPTQNGIDFISRLSAMTDTKACSIYLCSALDLQKDQRAQLESMGANVLDKAEICNRSVLRGLVESSQCVTGNK
ncbi:MAG: response regulator [Granulosicoccus sp.]